VFDADEDAEEVDAHICHEVLRAGIFEVARGRDAGVGEHDVETAVAGYGVVADGFHGGLGRGIEGVGVDVYGGEEGVEFAGVGGEVGGGEVAEVDCVGGVGGEDVGGGSSDAERGVGT